MREVAALERFYDELAICDQKDDFGRKLKVLGWSEHRARPFGHLGRNGVAR